MARQDPAPLATASTAPPVPAGTDGLSAATPGTALGAGGFVLLCLALADLALLPFGTSAALLLGSRCLLLAGGLWIAWESLRGAPADRTGRMLLVWQAALVLQHAATVGMWPAGPAQHVAGMVLMLLLVLVAPNERAPAVGLGFGIVLADLAGGALADRAPADLPATLIGPLAIIATGILLRRSTGAVPQCPVERRPTEASAISLAPSPAPLPDPLTRFRAEWAALLAGLPVPLLLLTEDRTELVRSLAASTLLQALPPSDLTAWLCAMTDGSTEASFTDMNGQPRRLEATMRTGAMDGRAVRVVVLADLTRQRSTEARLDDAERDRRLSEGRDTAALAELAHELRNPLNGITGFAQILADAALPPPYGDHAARLRMAAADMARAIDRHLALPAAPEPAVTVGTVLPLRILLVEDDEVSRMLARALLEQDGHSVRVATTGPEAVTEAAAGGFDLVLMDIRLPGFGGTTATRRIRALPDPAAARVPIVAMTANVLPAQQDRYRKAGMLAAVEKPVDRMRLRAVLAGIVPTERRPMLDTPAETGKKASPADSADVLDEAVLNGHLEILGPQRLRHVLDSFMASGPACVASAGEAMADHDPVLLAKAVHKLGSGALTVGLTRLATLARQVEADAVAGRADAALKGAAALPDVLEQGLTAVQIFRDRLPGAIQETSTPKR